MEKVQLFDCSVSHNKEHKIPKTAVTMKEIVLLRSIFGDEGLPEDSIKPHLDPKTGQQATCDIDPKAELFDLAKRYANTVDPLSGKRRVEKVFSTVLMGFEKWLEEQTELDNMEREERHRKAQADAAAHRLAEARKDVAAADRQPA